MGTGAQSEQPTQHGQFQGGYRGSPMRSLPLPNSELIVTVVTLAVIGIVCLSSNALGGSKSGVFIAATIVVVFGYLLSRGLAKRGNAVAK